MPPFASKLLQVCLSLRASTESVSHTPGDSGGKIPDHSLLMPELWGISCNKLSPSVVTMQGMPSSPSQMGYDQLGSLEVQARGGGGPSLPATSGGKLIYLSILNLTSLLSPDTPPSPPCFLLRWDKSQELQLSIELEEILMQIWRLCSPGRSACMHYPLLHCTGRRSIF